MPIVSSTHVVGHAQANGKCRVVETHTTNLGEVIRIEYGPVGVVDYQAVADARAVQIAEQLAEQECEVLISGT